VRVVERDTAQSVFNKLTAMTDGTAMVLAFPLPPSSVAWDEVRTACVKPDFTDFSIKALRDRQRNHPCAGKETLQVVVDRFFPAAEQKTHH
jgi:hypothetical protein